LTLTKGNRQLESIENIYLTTAKLAYANNSAISTPFCGVMIGQSDDWSDLVIYTG